MSALQVIEIEAGIGPKGEPVIEKIPVRFTEDGTALLVKSPAFIKGLASGDAIKYDAEHKTFTVEKRSGNLCIRVLSRSGIADISDELSPLIEKMGGELDTETERMLVFSVHVSCGFKQIEGLLNDYADEETMWFYGNVYDPKDGQTPLNWWQEILKPE